MTHVRLLPALLIAVAGLFCIKITHLVANSDSFVGSTMPVQAQEVQPPADPAAAATEQPAPTNSDAQEPPSLMDGMRVDQSSTSRSELAILERLAHRREELDERSKSLEMREALLKAAEKRLNERVQELRTLEESIKLATKERDREQQEDLVKLVAMYQSMRPKAAAKIFESLDIEVLTDMVKIMKPRTVAKIMGSMNPDAASKLSMAIARGETLEQEVNDLGSQELPQIGN
ncbi:hypothetical protein SAMN04515647_4585 [Cohaesibacter sp. ES.047]|uniref:MotE family protein n=1 Tax=Cohaesibacter sp. ES.047 TaxID=1798205 RepID=UPI000BB9689C|nr:hypothetical protein [Cohaesibacter sp. ES.047]SNY94262.1 hypothetical protein SAMN04515647_4585 [Cohaesibacter sp. ES.047]